MIKSYPRPETCLAHAHKCRAKANLAGDEKGRREFLDLARYWEAMAKDIHRLEILRNGLNARGKITGKQR
jgi:hypothetical protein